MNTEQLQIPKLTKDAFEALVKKLFVELLENSDNNYIYDIIISKGIKPLNWDDLRPYLQSLPWEISIPLCYVEVSQNMYWIISGRDCMLHYQKPL